ncbi:MAG: methyl-accepting chemotaxis protein [Hyphomicrobiales bacterium]
MNAILSNFFRNRSIRSTVVWSNLLLIGLTILIAIISFVALNQLLRNAEQSNELVGGFTEINKVSGELKKYLQTRDIQHIDVSEKLLISIQEKMNASSEHHVQQHSDKMAPLLSAMLAKTTVLKTGFELQRAENKDLQTTVYKLGSIVNARKRKAGRTRTQLLSDQNDNLQIEQQKQNALQSAYLLQDRIDQLVEILPGIYDALNSKQEKQATTALKNIVGSIEALHQIVDLTGTPKLYAEIETKVSKLEIGLKNLFREGLGSNISTADLEPVQTTLKTIETLVDEFTGQINRFESAAQSIDAELALIAQDIQKQDNIIQTVVAAQNAYNTFELAPQLNNQIVLKQRLDATTKIAEELIASKDTIGADLANALKTQIQSLTKIAIERNETISDLINSSLKTNVLISNASINSTRSAIDINKITTLLTATVIALAILLTFATIYVMTRVIVKPIGTMTDIMSRLAAGEIDVAAGFQKRANEIGKMQDAVEIFQSNAIQRIKLEKTTSLDFAREQTRQKEIDKLIANFKEEASTLLTSFNEQADEMHETAASMNSMVENAHKESAEAKDNSFASTSSIQTVATAAEELSISTQEITRQVQTTSAIVDQGASNATDTSNRISTLATSAQKIGDVVSLIQDIAEQTNLLALNATIEAARAGDHGRGFAVVASEVKSLASQTSHATSEIAQQIADIQAASDDAVEAIFSINEMMDNVKGHTETIAGSVTQQDAATQEISMSAKQASTDSRKISDNISNVSDTVQQTNASATAILNSSNRLSQNATRLNDHVETFLKKVATA